MNKEFAEKWLSKLKEYWFNKDIESSVSLFTKTTFSIIAHLCYLWNNHYQMLFLF